MFETPEDDLIFDIAMGLKRAKAGPMEDCERMAKTVLEHLKLCAWKIEKGPVAPAH